MDKNETTRRGPYSYTTEAQVSPEKTKFHPPPRLLGLRPAWRSMIGLFIMTVTQPLPRYREAARRNVLFRAGARWRLSRRSTSFRVFNKAQQERTFDLHDRRGIRS